MIPRPLAAGLFIVKTPREAIKQAFQSGLINNGHDWIDALQDRNLTAHTCNEETAIAVWLTFLVAIGYKGLNRRSLFDVVGLLRAIVRTLGDRAYQAIV